MTVVTRVVALATIAAALFSTTPAHAQSRTIWVQSNGSDTPTCGLTKSQSCRSISAGIARANTGDLVLVGPGRYGDIDNDLQYVTPGDEAADLNLRCVVCITKRVTVASTDGANATVIDPGRPGPGQSLPQPLAWTVRINASGARFGAQNQGFTIFALPGSAVFMEGVGDIRVIGNVSYGGGVGMDLNAENGPVFVGQNRMFNAQAQALVVRLTNSQGTIMENLAANSGIGIDMTVVAAGSAAPPIISRNRAARNSVGFSFLAVPEGTNSRATISNNVASANREGFSLSANGINLVRNTAIGNDEGFSLGGVPGGAPNSFHTNNMIGNRLCGFHNRSGTHVDATNNFWGSPAGPGPKPSDAVCNDVYPFDPSKPSTTTSVPFATKAF
jgi:hypothetical protein